MKCEELTNFKFYTGVQFKTFRYEIRRAFLSKYQNFFFFFYFLQNKRAF